MVWTSPQSWTTGMTLSGTTAASGLNVQLSDNMTAMRNCWDMLIHLSLSANQSIANAANTSVVWDTIDFQANSSVTMWASASGARLIVPWSGRYELSGSLEWVSNTSGARSSIWSMNGATDYTIQSNICANASRGFNCPIGALVNVTTADHIQIKAWQNTGAALNLHGGTPDRSRVGWRFVGAAS